MIMYSFRTLDISGGCTTAYCLSVLSNVATRDFISTCKWTMCENMTTAVFRLFKGVFCKQYFKLELVLLSGNTVCNT